MAKKSRPTGKVARCDLTYVSVLDKSVQALGKRACQNPDHIGEARRDLSVRLRDVEACYKEIKPRATATPTTSAPTVPAVPPWYIPGGIEF